MSESDQTIFMEKLDNVLDETWATIRPALVEYQFHYFDRLEVVGIAFPSNVTQWLAEQRLERDKQEKPGIPETHEEWSGSIQVRDILKGEWSGKHHWDIED